MSFFGRTSNPNPDDSQCTLISKTKKTHFYVGLKTETALLIDKKKVIYFQPSKSTNDSSSVDSIFSTEPNQSVVVEKRVVILSSLDIEKDQIDQKLTKEINKLRKFHL
jgi:trehalose/maltose hydrolase-like predicted phosphorylase